MKSPQTSELLKLCEFNSNDKFKLLYRASRDGFHANKFHSKCDGHMNTLTIFKARETSYVFGAFTLATWESFERGEWKSDPNAFLFSLTNKDNEPCKMKIDADKSEYAIYCRSRRGPSFGCSMLHEGRDIYVADNADIEESSSNLGYTYKHSKYLFGTCEAKSFFAGSEKFQLSEIEVYQKV